MEPPEPPRSAHLSETLFIIGDVPLAGDATPEPVAGAARESCGQSRFVVLP